MRLKQYLCLLCVLFGSFVHAQDSEEYQFKGCEFQANYYGCDAEALSDMDGLARAMEEAVKASGATILKTAEYRFEPMGFTMMLLLSESHASIHTYPEKGACFIDLFTCGEHCKAERFDAVMAAYLKPKRNVSVKYVRDDEGIREIPSEKSTSQLKEKLSS